MRLSRNIFLEDFKMTDAREALPKDREELAHWIYIFPARNGFGIRRAWDELPENRKRVFYAYADAIISDRLRVRREVVEEVKGAVEELRKKDLAERDLAESLSLNERYDGVLAKLSEIEKRGA
jgi:hypothetical protein